MTKCLLVRSSRFYGWPKGKVEDGESDASCAIREVWEEVGLDISDRLSERISVVVALQRGYDKSGGAANGRPKRSMQDSTSSMKLYIIPGIPESTSFVTSTMHEITDIAWFNVSQLPDASDRWLNIQPILYLLLFDRSLPGLPPQILAI
jgi:mRNA-decapping enzyme subunit 2